MSRVGREIRAGRVLANVLVALLVLVGVGFLYMSGTARGYGEFVTYGGAWLLSWSVALLMFVERW